MDMNRAIYDGQGTELEKSFLSEQILTLIPQNQSYFGGLEDLVMDQIM